MCCYRDVAAGKRLMERFGPRKTLRFWKVLEADGAAWVADYRYRPGVNVSNFEDKYRLGSPRGIHVYPGRVKDLPSLGWGNARQVAVICHRDDFIRAEPAQAVFKKVIILKADWAAAGLPVRKGKR